MHSKTRRWFFKRETNFMVTNYLCKYKGILNLLQLSLPWVIFMIYPHLANLISRQASAIIFYLVLAVIKQVFCSFMTIKIIDVDHDMCILHLLPNRKRNEIKVVIINIVIIVNYASLFIIEAWLFTNFGFK